MSEIAPMPWMERAKVIRPVVLSVECPACGAEEDIDALSGLEELESGAYRATEAACVPCDCGALIEVGDIEVSFTR